MKGLALNNLKTQLELYQEALSDSQSIEHEIRNKASQLLNEMIEDRMFIKDEQKTVEFTVEEFNKLRVFIAQLAFKTRGLDQMSDRMKELLFTRERTIRIIRSLED